MKCFKRAAVLLLVFSPTTWAATPGGDGAVTERIHGVEISDPYRWLEGSDAPEIDADPALDARVAAWTREQNARTREVLDHLDTRSLFADRLEELLEAGTVGLPKVRGDRYFYLERHGRQAQDVLYVRRGHDGDPRVLLDPNLLEGGDGLTSLSWFEPDAEGTVVAVGLYRGGDENSTLYLLDATDLDGGDDAAVWLADEIPGKVLPVDWLPDSSGFFYRRLADVEDPYSAQIKLHYVGRHHRHDPVLFEQYHEGPLATTWGPYPFADREARWLGIVYYTGTDSNDLWVFDARHWRQTGELRRTDVVIGEKATSTGVILGDTLYLFTTLEAPRGRIMAVDLRHPERARWREIVPEPREATIETFSVARGRLAVQYLDNASTRLEIFDLDGVSQGDLELPGIGSAELATEPDRSEAFLAFESFQYPESIFRVDLVTGRRELWARPEVEVDSEDIVVRQVYFESKDGTRVPMFVVHPQGIELDGTHPTLLSGYGGFNQSITPAFKTRIVPWVEAGGIYVSVNLRGGGEYGEAWHRAGMLDKKQNVFDDFIAAAEWLIEHRYTGPRHLGIWGASNGGLLTGAAVVQRPELFSAAISAVPLLDMLRYQDFLMARYWVPEYGSAENPDDLPFLLAYSPYHNVKPGTPYPAVLLTAGENDSRVHPLHARKMAARLQAATSSDPETEPILLWVEGDVGHGRGKPLELRRRETTDWLSFLAWQLGLAASNDVEIETPDVAGAG